MENPRKSLSLYFHKNKYLFRVAGSYTFEMVVTVQIKKPNKQKKKGQTSNGMRNNLGMIMHLYIRDESNESKANEQISITVFLHEVHNNHNSKVNGLALKYSHMIAVEQINVFGVVEKCRCLKYKTPPDERRGFRQALTTELVLQYYM